MDQDRTQGIATPHHLIGTIATGIKEQFEDLPISGLVHFMHDFVVATMESPNDGRKFRKIIQARRIGRPPFQAFDDCILKSNPPFQFYK